MQAKKFVDIMCPLHDKKTETTLLFECPPNNWAQDVSLQVVKCNECGLVFFSPNLSPSVRRAYHGEEYFRAPEKGCVGYPDYVEDGHVGAKVYFGKLLVHWCHRLWKGKTNPPSSVIDLGCATGHMLVPFQTKGYDPVVGIDFSKWAVEWGKSNLGIDLRCQDMDALRLGKEEMFDCIIFWDSLEHAQKPRQLLRKLYAHSPEEAVMIVQMPDVDQFGDNPDHPFWSLYQHAFHYNEETLTKLMELEGFSVQKRLPSSQAEEMLFAVTKA